MFTCESCFSCRSVVEGPMLFCRFGTCGGLKADVPEGTVVVSSLGALSVMRLPDAFEEPEAKGAPVGCAYHISKVRRSARPLARPSRVVGAFVRRRFTCHLSPHGQYHRSHPPVRW